MSEQGEEQPEDESNSGASDAPTEFHDSGDASVIDSLGKTIGLDPRVSLRSSGELEGPVVRTNSKELDGAALPDASRYRLDGEIARGGMGAILKGRDTDLGRDLAIKVLLGEHRDRPEVIQRFVEEAQIGGQLQHPGIVPVHELGQFKDGCPFFTMKLVKGKTLSALLAERDSPSDDRSRFVGIFEQVCQTMAYAHSRGVIHRDLKPANIMVGAFGEVQVMDWGLAKVLAEGGVADEKRAEDERPDVSIIQTSRSLGSNLPEVGSSLGSGSGSHTLMGSVMGTPAYMPPEQALGEIDRLDERSDVFGLGAILCELLTGKPPYVGKDRKEVFQNAARAKLDDCRQRLEESDADSELNRLALDCLEPEPKDRIRDAGALADRVAGYLESAEDRLRQAQLEKVKADTQVAEERKRRLVTMGLAASILATLIVGGGGWIWVKQKDAAIERAEYEQRAKLAQQVRQELSTARALGSVESGKLPDPLSLGRAVEAIERADSFRKNGEVDDELSHELDALREQLVSAKRDQDFKSDLGAAWQKEMEYRRQRNSSISEEGRISLESPMELEAREEAHPRHAYERAFSNWGIEIGEIGTAAATRKLNSIPIDLQHFAFASLDRWRSLLNEPTHLWQWQCCDWTPLSSIKLTSRSGDKLKILEDQSILASGDNPYAGYDLEFETDCQELSALRLEALLHESFPANGPGRGHLGEFGLYELKVFWAPRTDPAAKKRLRFSNAVADFSWSSDEITTASWNITNGAGEEHAAVFEVEEPPQCAEGFRIWITHGDRPRGDWEDQNLGRFRWSATTEANNKRRHRVRSRTIQAVVESADPNTWRNAMRRELVEEDVMALIRRANDVQGCADQPIEILVQLADALRRVNGKQLMDAISQSVNWQVAELANLVSKQGVTLTTMPDNSVKATGALPGNDTISMSAKIGAKRLTAIRLELIPELRSDGYPEKNLGRNGQLVLRECSVFTSDSSEASEAAEKTSVPVDFAFADFPWWASVVEIFDGDFDTFKSIGQQYQPRSIVLALKPVDLSEKDELRLNLSSGFGTFNTVSRFRISFTEDPLPEADVQKTALNLLERMSERDPSNYWAHLELARSYRKQLPPQYENSRRHANAAVALYPDQLAGHDAMLRATPMTEARFENQLGKLVRRHHRAIREQDYKHRILSSIIYLAYRTAAQCASDKDFDGARSCLRLASELDAGTPGAAQGLWVNNFAWDLLTDLDNDSAEVFDVAVALAERSIELAPDNASFANTLGVGYARAERWEDALTELNRCVKLSDGGGIDDWFFLAQANWHVGSKDEARRWLEKADAYMENDEPHDLLKRVQDETHQLMGIAPEDEAADEVEEGGGAEQDATAEPESANDATNSEDDQN